MSRYRSCVPVHGLDPLRPTCLDRIRHDEPTSQQKRTNITSCNLLGIWRTWKKSSKLTSFHFWEVKSSLFVGQHVVPEGSWAAFFKSGIVHRCENTWTIRATLRAKFQQVASFFLSEIKELPFWGNNFPSCVSLISRSQKTKNSGYVMCV